MMSNHSRDEKRWQNDDSEPDSKEKESRGEKQDERTRSANKSSESDNDRESKRRRSKVEKKKKRRRSYSSDSSTSEDRRKKHRKEKKKKRKKDKKKRNSDDESCESGENGQVRRSIITGKKIKMHINKSKDDLAQEEARKKLLQFMNSSL
jgi:hypothetical protein